MSEFRDALAELESSVAKEVARLSRPIAIDSRSELVFRVWPFLHELLDTLLLLDDEEPPPVPVDLVARAVGLMMGMLNHLGQPMTQEQLGEIAAHVHDVAEGLIALVDADELAAYVADATQPAAVEPAPLKVIDVSPRPGAIAPASIEDATIVQSTPAPSAPAPTVDAA